MKLLIAAVVSLAATSSLAHADEDPGMQLMKISMRCPAISSDGKHVAIYSIDPGTEKGAMTSLTVFGATGALEQRISVVPPNTDAAKAKAAAAKIVKLLDAGGYKRMSPIKQSNDNTKTMTPTLNLNSEDVTIDLQLAGRKVTIAATRAGKKLAEITRTLAAKDGRCKKADAYSVPNTLAGYDTTTQLFALSVQPEENDESCFAHNFVVKLK